MCGGGALVAPATGTQPLSLGGFERNESRQRALSGNTCVGFSVGDRLCGPRQLRGRLWELLGLLRPPAAGDHSVPFLLGRERCLRDVQRLRDQLCRPQTPRQVRHLLWKRRLHQMPRKGQDRSVTIKRVMFFCGSGVPAAIVEAESPSRRAALRSRRYGAACANPRASKFRVLFLWERRPRRDRRGRKPLPQNCTSQPA